MKKIFDINIILKKISFHQYLGLLCFGIAISVVIYFFNNVNYSQIDFGGHMASTVMFQKYGLHGWNPNWFQGLINNLFYPPLEDTIVAIIHFVSGASNSMSFVIYISCIIFAYWFGVYRLIRSIKYRSVAIFMFLGLGLYFFLNKASDIMYFQGGGFFDLIYTGLTTQSLGTIFLLFFVAEYIKDIPNPWKLGLYSSLSFLAHLVIGPVIFLVWAILIVFTKSKRNHLYSFLLSIGITSLFRLPFLVYKGLSISSFIVFNPPLLFLIIPIVVALVAYRKNLFVSLPLLLTSILIILPNYMATWWYALMGSNLPIPVFHYYRFASISLLCAIIGVLFFFDYLYQQQAKRGQLHQTTIMWGNIILGAGFVTLFLHFGCMNFNQIHSAIHDRVSQTTETTKIDRDYLMLNNGKKILTIDIYRPIDFGIDSYFQYSTPGLPFVKGLFWESAKGNQLISSYLATLISQKNMILDFYISTITTQAEYNKLWDSFIDQYNIGRIFFAPKANIRYLQPQQAQMLVTTISSGTFENDFVLKDRIVIKGISYAVYQITPKNTASFDGSVRPLTKNTKIISLVNERLFADQILNMYKIETGSRADYIFFDKKNMPLSGTIIPYSNSYTPKYTLINGVYTVDFGSSPQTIIIRIPDLPGRTFQGEQGQKVQFWNGLYEKIVSSTGIVTISYHRPLIMIIAYIVSLLSLCLFVYAGFTYRVKK